MSEVSLSAGWVFLIAGAIGIIGAITGKRFSWKSSEYLTSEEDRADEGPISPLIRWIIIGICAIVCAYGVIQLQRDHGWNPFIKGTSSQAGAPVRWRNESRPCKM